MAIDLVFLTTEEQKKLAIVNGVTRSIDSMTVKEICDEAGVSRQQFYRLFESKSDMSLWFTLFLTRIYLTEIGRTLTWEEGLRQDFELHLSNKKVVENFVSGYIGGEPMTSRTIIEKRVWCEKRRERIVETLRIWHDIEPDERMLFYIDTYSNTEFVARAEWVQNHMLLSPEEMAKRLVYCVPDPLYEALSLPHPKYGNNDEVISTPSLHGSTILLDE